MLRLPGYLQFGETGRNLSTRRTEHKRQDAQVVETSVTINNSPIQDYVPPEDHVQPTYDTNVW